MKKIILMLVAMFILDFNIAMAAEVWTFPGNAVKLEGVEKQNYICEKMNAIFRPALDKKNFSGKF